MKIIGFILILLSAMIILIVKAAVILVSFTATPQDAVIQLDWETDTESNNSGFYISRSLEEFDGYERISDFILSSGDDVSDGVYNFADEDVSINFLYFYMLEAIGNDQSIDYHGPISATLGIITPTITTEPTNTSTSSKTGEPTNTATITNTSTPTKTGGPTSTKTITRTPTRTGSPSPTSTPTPFLSLTPSNTALISATPSSTPTQSKTPTLVPLPEIIFAYPLPFVELPTLPPTSLPPSTQTPTPIIERDIWYSLVESGIVNRYGLIIAVIALWGVVSGSIYLFITRSKKTDE